MCTLLWMCFFVCVCVLNNSVYEILSRSGFPHIMSGCMPKPDTISCRLYSTKTLDAVEPVDQYIIWVLSCADEFMERIFDPMMTLRFMWHAETLEASMCGILSSLWREAGLTGFLLNQSMHCLLYKSHLRHTDFLFLIHYHQIAVQRWMLVYPLL